MTDKSDQRVIGVSSVARIIAWQSPRPISLAHWNERIECIAWRLRVLHARTYPLAYRTVLRLLARKTHSEKLSGSRFSDQFNSLAAKELEPVFRPFAAFRSAVLGERPA